MTERLRTRGQRINPAHAESARRRIQTSQIINRLNLHATGGNDPVSGEPVEMTPTQLKAAEILLRKVLPDLAAIDATLAVSHVSHEQALTMLESAASGDAAEDGDDAEIAGEAIQGVVIEGEADQPQ